jgi:hypothetical protein
VFNWKILRENAEYVPNLKSFDESQIGLSHIEYGCKLLESDFPFIGRVCAGILVENLALWKRDEQDTILTPYLNQAEGPDVRDRACLLCAIVRTGSLYYEPLSRYQFAIATQLTCDAPFIDDATKVVVLTALQSLGENGDGQTKRLVRDWREGAPTSDSGDK